MAKYCQKCNKLIEEGKEVRFKEGINYRGSRYSYGPRNWAYYYLHPECFQQEKEELATKDDKFSQRIGWILVVVLIVVAALAGLFFLYQYHQDRKIDRITKKSQKK